MESFIDFHKGKSMPLPLGESKPDLSRPKLRWCQYSLRTLLLGVLLASIGMSWFTPRIQRARKQREAVEAIERLGGEVLYDFMCDDSGK
jgi:hypothetical protein